MSIVFTILLIASAQAFPQMSEQPIHSQFVHIINGKEAVPYSLPYEVGIFITSAAGMDFCGGSLISKRHVLTAAHCLHGAWSVRLLFGAHYINEKYEEGRQVRNVNYTNFIIHPDWSRDNYMNDIGIVELVTPIAETDHIKCVELAFGSYDYAYRQGVVAGWGKTTNNQTGTSDVLYYIDSEIMTNDDCRAVDESYNEVIRATNLCLSGRYDDVNVSTCGGDSGGPLVVEDVQVGLSSFGLADCMVGYPSVFTRVSEYYHWIRNVIGSDN